MTEMAERHDAKAVLRIARGLVHRLQDMIENKWTWLAGTWLSRCSEFPLLEFRLLLLTRRSHS